VNFWHFVSSWNPASFQWLIDRVRKFPRSVVQEKLYHWSTLSASPRPDNPSAAARRHFLNECTMMHSATARLNWDGKSQMHTSCRPCARMHPAQPLHAPQKVKLKSYWMLWVCATRCCCCSPSARRWLHVFIYQVKCTRQKWGHRISRLGPPIKRHCINAFLLHPN
jgi:hypothetical protein